MKVTLEFNLPEEREDFDLANEGPALSGAIKDVLEDIRTKLKYEGLTDEQIDCYEEVRAIILDRLDQWEIRS